MLLGAKGSHCGYSFNPECICVEINLHSLKIENLNLDLRLSLAIFELILVACLILFYTLLTFYWQKLVCLHFMT